MTFRCTGTLRREKAAMVYLRKNHKYSINELAVFFGRSKSLIHQVIHFNELIGNLAKSQLRNMPNRIRLLAAQSHRVSMDYWINQWQAFILGEEDKPP